MSYSRDDSKMHKQNPKGLNEKRVKFFLFLLEKLFYCTILLLYYIILYYIKYYIIIIVLLYITMLRLVITVDQVGMHRIAIS